MERKSSSHLSKSNISKSLVSPRSGARSKSRSKSSFLSRSGSRSGSRSSSGEYIEMKEIHPPTPLSFLFTDVKNRDVLSEINKYLTEKDIGTQRQVSKTFKEKYGDSFISLLNQYEDLSKKALEEPDLSKSVKILNQGKPIFNKILSIFEMLNQIEIDSLPKKAREQLKQIGLIERKYNKKKQMRADIAKKSSKLQSRSRPRSPSRTSL